MAQSAVASASEEAADRQVVGLALGHTIELDKHNTSSDTDCYRVSASAARIYVVADPDPYASGDPDPDGH